MRINVQGLDGGGTRRDDPLAGARAAVVQNVHAMRAGGARGLRRGAGDGRGRRRVRTCASSASSPSCATRWSRCTATTRASRRVRARCCERSPRPPRPRAPSCARSTTSARSRPTGSSASRRSATSTYVDRFAGTLHGVRERLPYLRELGVSYLHLMPLLRARPAPNDGGYAVVDYGAVEPALGTMDDLRALAADAARARDGAVRRPGAQPHRARAPVGAGRARRRPGVPRLLPDVPGPHRARRLRAHAARRLPGHRARHFTLGRRARPLGVDDVQRLPVGPRLHEPRRLRRDGRGDARPRRPRASTCCAWTPCRSCGSGWAPTARTSPRSTSCCRPSARRCGSPRPPWPSRPRRSSPRATSSPTSAPAATRARSATSPTTTC